MAKTKKSKAHVKKNTGHKKHHKAIVKRNAGAMRSGVRGIGQYAINGLFVVAGALGTKLLTQMVLGSSNKGLMGYGVNAAMGAALWFATDSLLKNPSASAGVVSGAVVQIIIRLINDYTPFGQYVAQLGMGDYQAQSFLTPQILVDPYNSAAIRFPPALMPRPAAPPAVTMAAGAGVSGFDPLYSGGSGLYS